MTPSASSAIPGRIDRLFLKSAHGQSVREVEPGAAVRCIAGLGLAGDVHAHRLSPRQVLVTLASELEELSVAAGALHENLVISLALPQAFRPGAALVFDSGVTLRLTMFCEPCKRISPVVGKLKAVLHRRGILGVVVGSGELRQGDRLNLVPQRYGALTDDMRQRFIDAVATIPAGHVVRYADLAIALGVDRSFIRALPGYIKRAAGLSLPLHRIVSARGALLPFMPAQAELLAAEGIAVSAGAVDVKRHLWQGEAITHASGERTFSSGIIGEKLLVKP